MRKVDDVQILIVNAGGQYCHLIGRRVREAGVQSIICAPEELMPFLSKSESVKGVIISGGPSSVYNEGSPKVSRDLFQMNLPVLGLCYGHQLLAQLLEGEVTPGKEHEYGEAEIQIDSDSCLLSGLQATERVWMSHGDEVISVPPGFAVLARSESCRVAAMGDPLRKLFGVQFHPEVTDTPCGRTILENFLFKICDCQKDWELTGLVKRLREQIQREVGDRHVLFFVSGGVDSTVAFALCTDALSPDRVVGVFVDTGFMRKGERAEIETALAQRGWHNVRVEDESDLFLTALNNISDPEEKRKRIGECFLKVQRKVEKTLFASSTTWMLGQGTIYPDTIESGHGKQAAVIKTHHNRVAGIQELIDQGLVLEPLREFYKDEVRDIGRQLGLPDMLVDKNPFPGPGLAVRCLCSNESHLVTTSAEASILAGKFGLSTWSVPIRTVGVQGDYRSYSNLIILAGEAKLEDYASAARRLVREIRATNRVAFLVGPDSPDILRKAQVHKGFIDSKRLDLLREADFIAHDMLRKAGLAAEVWQFPVVLLPLGLGTGETIALRPVYSVDAMTARHAHLRMDFIKQVGKALLALDNIDLVLYDVTDKPPATIEWE